MPAQLRNHVLSLEFCKLRLPCASADAGHVRKLAANQSVACALVSASVCFLGPATFWTLLPIIGEDLDTSLAT